jgi:hypothetical protein
MKLKLHLTSTAFAIAAILALAGSGGVIAMEPGELETRAAAADTTGEPKPGRSVPTSNPLSGNPEAIDSGGQLFHTWCAQ